MQFKFWKSCPPEALSQPRDLDWSEVDVEVKYLAFPHEKSQHWTKFSFVRFVEVVEKKRQAKKIPKAVWAWYFGEKKDKLEITDEDEFHVLLKRFKSEYNQRKGEDTIRLSMIRGPEKAGKVLESSAQDELSDQQVAGDAKE